MVRSLASTAAFVLFWLTLAQAAHAHSGPPIPLFVDYHQGQFVISVWADPDVGVGRFYITLDPAPNTTLPEGMDVEVCVEPVSGRLPETSYSAARQCQTEQAQYYAEVGFDREEQWRIRVRVNGSGENLAEVVTEVEATPPGYGRWDLLIYGFPFVLFGMLWLFVALRRKRRGEVGNVAACSTNVGNPSAVVGQATGRQQSGHMQLSSCEDIGVNERQQSETATPRLN